MTASATIFLCYYFPSSMMMGWEVCSIRFKNHSHRYILVQASLSAFFKVVVEHVYSVCTFASSDKMPLSRVALFNCQNLPEGSTKPRNQEVSCVRVFLYFPDIFFLAWRKAVE